MADVSRDVDSNGGKGHVALTFDDGPNDNTATLLETLARCGVRATLFNLGEGSDADPSLVRAEAKAGMWIGNHSYTHPHLLTLDPGVVREELARTQTSIAEAGGGRPTLFRPPFGETDEGLAEIASSLGLRVVMWDVDSGDWNGATTEEIVGAAARLQDGQIMLMHDRHATTIAAIPRIVAGLAGRGLAVGMIDPVSGRAVPPRG